MIDYEKLASEAPGPEPAAGFDLNTLFPSPEGPLDPAEAQSRANRITMPPPVPVTAPRYQGLAEAKGYAQTPNRIKKTRYNHDAMIDVLIAEPEITQRKLAERFGRTEAWISVIIGSDAFQAALAKRREELSDPYLVASIEERLNGLAQQSIQVLTEKLESTRNPDLAVKGLEIAAKALGFGARPSGPTTPIQNNFVVQLPSKIENAADWAKVHGGPTIEQS